MLTRITGGRIVDPHNAHDAVSDIFFQDDRIVAPPKSSDAERCLDARGCIVMSGAIDMHTHIGGGKATLARLLLGDIMPRERAADSEFLPAAMTAGKRYLDMGYSCCFEPAMLPCNARAAHAELAAVSGIDTGAYCLLGNDDVLLSMIADRLPQQMINDYVAWIVSATQAIAVKVVNPGGISAFKFNQRSLNVDEPHPTYGVTPCEVIGTLSRAVYEIGLAHPLHVHCSNLGVPGNIRSTIATINAAHGYPIHLAHAQFHCYGDSGPYGMSSAAQELARALEKHPNVTLDVGQVMFGQTVTISADTAHQYRNRRHARPRKSILLDVECEAGCGVVPFRYRRKHFVHSLQWAIGLELFLMVGDPRRVFLTTDHPNGAPFTTYPHVLRLLGDRSFRETALNEIDSEAAASSSLSGMSREYGLNEIAVMTRAAPATLLGLSDRGNLSPGSVADIVVYQSDQNLERMFAQPRYVIRRGVLIRGETSVESPPIEPLTLTADLNCRQPDGIAERFESMSAMSVRNLQISDDELHGVIGSQRVRNVGRERVR